MTNKSDNPGDINSWYWYVLSAAFFIISVVFAFWSTNREWNFSHDCQCGTPYGLSSGDYVSRNVFTLIIPGILIGVGLLIHPLGGLVGSITVIGIEVVSLGLRLREANPGQFSVFTRGHVVFLIIFGCVGVIVSILKLWTARRQRQYTRA